MIRYTVALIKKTNGDALGVILFILLIIHFINLESPSTFDNVLMTACVAALVVDLNIVLRHM